MRECVASSISRWHGCKAESYLLSCSTHSDFRWEDDRRRGTQGFYFSEAATKKLLPQAKDTGERHRIVDTASYLYREGQQLQRKFCPRPLYTGKKEMCKSVSTPQDNPSGSQLATANAHTDTYK